MFGLLARLLRNLARWSGRDPIPEPRPEPVPTDTPTPGPVPPPPATEDVNRVRVVATINAVRASAGLPALLEDPKLDGSAEGWARFMASGQGLTHADFAARISALYPNTSAGEDIAEGQPTPEAVVDAWMSSPRHRANILGDFARLGVGSSPDARGSTFWCVEFVGAD